MKRRVRRSVFALFALIALASQLTACTISAPGGDTASWQALTDALRSFVTDFAREALAAALV